MVHPGSPGMMLPHLAFQSVAEKKKNGKLFLSFLVLISKTVKKRVTLHLSACKVPFIIAEETRAQKLSDGKNPDLYWESIRNAGARSHQISWERELKCIV